MGTQTPMDLDEAQRRLRGYRIVWIAMVASVLLYFAVVATIPTTVTPTNPAANAAIERVLVTLAVAYVAISIPAKRWLLAQAKAVDSPRLRGMAFIAPLVLCEAAAVTGLALHFATGSPNYYVFLLLALAGMALHFPRRLG